MSQVATASTVAKGETTAHGAEKAFRSVVISLNERHFFYPDGRTNLENVAVLVEDVRFLRAQGSFRAILVIGGTRATGAAFLQRQKAVACTTKTEMNIDSANVVVSDTTKAAAGATALNDFFRQLFGAMGIPTITFNITAAELANEQRGNAFRSALNHFALRGVVPLVFESEITPSPSLIDGDADRMACHVGTDDSIEYVVLFSDAHEVFLEDPSINAEAEALHVFRRSAFTLNPTRAQAIAKALRAGGTKVLVVPITEREPLCRIARGDSLGTLYDDSMGSVEDSAFRRQLMDRRNSESKQSIEKRAREKAEWRALERKMDLEAEKRRVEDAMMFYPEDMRKRMATALDDPDARHAKPFIGFSLAPHVARCLGDVLLVDWIYERCPAYFAGIRPGDFVLSFAWIPCTTVDDARRAVATHCKVGHVVPLLCHRAGRGDYLAELWIMSSDPAYTGKTFFFEAKGQHKMKYLIALHGDL